MTEKKTSHDRKSKGSPSKDLPKKRSTSQNRGANQPRSSGTKKQNGKTEGK